MRKLYIELKENNDGDYITYTIVNKDEIWKAYMDLCREEQAYRHDAYKGSKDDNVYHHKTPVLVNNLKLIADELGDTVGYKLKYEKQVRVKDEDFNTEKGVANIKTASTNYVKFIDMNAIVSRQTDVIETREEFENMSRVVEKLIEENGGDIPNGVPALIRKQIKNAYETDELFRKIQWSMRVSGEEFKYYKQYYQGGLCMSNDFFLDKKLSNVHHYDLNSAYISVMCEKNYPLSKPFVVNKKNLPKNREELEKIVNKVPCLFEMVFNNIRPKEWNINPLKIESGKSVRLYLTNPTWFILKDAYKWDGSCLTHLEICSKYGQLPESVINIMKGLFTDKKEMKDLKGTEEFDIDEYTCRKLKVNCSYGIFGSGLDVRYCNIFWALFTTAWQRYILWSAIKELGTKYFIYGDTDSVFSTIKSVKFTVGSEMGEWEYERLKNFKIVRNKGYLCEDYRGNMSLTLSSAKKNEVKKYIADLDISNDELFELFDGETFSIDKSYGTVYRYKIHNGRISKKLSEFHVKSINNTVDAILDRLGVE